MSSGRAVVTGYQATLPCQTKEAERSSGRKAPRCGGASRQSPKKSQSAGTRTELQACFFAYTGARKLKLSGRTKYRSRGPRGSADDALGWEPGESVAVILERPKNYKDLYVLQIYCSRAGAKGARPES